MLLCELCSGAETAVCAPARCGSGRRGARRLSGLSSLTAWHLAGPVHDGALEHYAAHHLSVHGAVGLTHPLQGGGVEDPGGPVGRHAGCWRLAPGELPGWAALDVGSVAFGVDQWWPT